MRFIIGRLELLGVSASSVGPPVATLVCRSEPSIGVPGKKRSVAELRGMPPWREHSDLCYCCDSTQHAGHIEMSLVRLPNRRRNGRQRCQNQQVGVPNRSPAGPDMATWHVHSEDYVQFRGDSRRTGPHLLAVL